MIGIHNRYLPLWVHRVFDGILGTVACATLASLGMSKLPTGHLLYGFSVVLLYLCLPVGILLAVFTRRCAIVEGCAGDGAYDELTEEQLTTEPNNQN